MFRLSMTGRLFSTLVAITTGALVSCAQPAPDAGPSGEARSGVRAPLPDCLYVGDAPPGGATSQIQLFDPLTGAYAGEFIEDGTVISIRGLVFDRRNRGANPNLIVVDQNVTGPAGQILRFRKPTGALVDVIVSPDDEEAPFAPRGAVLRNGILYVADMGDPGLPGRVATYDARTGEWLGDLEPACYGNRPFHPRAVVFGPDGLLYVSVIRDPTAGVPGGAIVRFDVETGECDVFIDSDTCGCGLHRPEGLTFGPDGNLYVTSYVVPSDPTSRDRILVFDGRTGQLLDEIVLAVPPARALPIALVFGPEGKLYVTVQFPGPPPSGEVRVYDVATETYEVLVPEGLLIRPAYFTFCGTDPATLAYEPQRHCACGQ